MYGVGWMVIQLTVKMLGVVIVDAQLRAPLTMAHEPLLEARVKPSPGIVVTGSVSGKDELLHRGKHAERHLLVPVAVKVAQVPVVNQVP